MRRALYPVCHALWHFYTVVGLSVRHTLWVNRASLCVHHVLPKFPRLPWKNRGRALVVDLGRPLGENGQGEMGKNERRGKKRKGSETLVLIITILQPNLFFFLVILSWLTLSFWVPFKHLIHTKSLTNSTKKRCQQGLPLDFLAFAKIWNSL